MLKTRKKSIISVNSQSERPHRLSILNEVISDDKQLLVMENLANSFDAFEEAEQEIIGADLSSFDENKIASLTSTMLEDELTATSPLVN